MEKTISKVKRQPSEWEEIIANEATEQQQQQQITNGIFHETRTQNFTIHMETQKTPNSQNSLEKEEWSWRNQHFPTSDYTTKLQSSRQHGTGTKTDTQTNGTR